jgi:hypothetical protein
MSLSVMKVPLRQVGRKQIRKMDNGPLRALAGR